MYVQGLVEPIIPMVSTFTTWGHIFGNYATSSAVTGRAFIAANAVQYQPVFVPSACVARRLWWANATSGSYNVSAAIYASTASGEPGAKIIECGSTAQGTSNEVQFVDITDTSLAPGTYWIALAGSSGSLLILGVVQPNQAWNALLQFQQTSITLGALPATATPVESSYSNTFLFGFATTASP